MIARPEGEGLLVWAKVISAALAALEET